MLLDLVKAFDRVPHSWLVHNAKLYDFPLLVLRVSIASYCLGRVICVDCIVSSIIFATRSITAGSVLATIEMRLLLIRSIDDTMYKFPDVEVTVYVDDTSLEGVGPPMKVLRFVAEAIRFLTDDFIFMELEFSPTKNVCVASRSSLAEAAVRRLPKLHLKAAMHAKGLGAAISAGKKRNASVLNIEFPCLRGCVGALERIEPTCLSRQAAFLLLPTASSPLESLALCCISREPLLLHLGTPLLENWA